MKIEEKAKAYDEALKYAKIYYTSGDEDMKMMMKTCFPALVEESEDERIRKALMQNLKERFGTKGYMGEGLDMPDVLTWLEKQGEQKPADKVEPKFKVGDVVTNKKSKDTVKIVQILHDSYCYSGWDGAATVHSDFSISEQDGWELVEQKPAEWSDDDEKRMNHIIQFLEDKDRWKDSERAFPIEEDIRWLKSLKDRVACEVNCTTTKEWSEEDRKIIIELIGIFESAVDGGHVSFPYRLIKDYIRVLKSCLPQTTWKPSDDEMKALAEALSLANNCGEEYAFDLRTLQDQLKKLK